MTFASFLRLQLQPSAVSRGLAYELLVLSVLKNYSFQLMHTGRPGDRGQDFFGHWLLPDRRVQVIGQCKCQKNRLRPADVREFEGVLHRKWRHDSQCIGVLVNQNGFSTKSVEAAQSCRLPLALCQVTAHVHHHSSDRSPYLEEAGVCNRKPNGGGSLDQFVLNSLAQRLLPDVGMAWRQELCSAHSTSTRELLLLYRGNPIN